MDKREAESTVEQELVQELDEAKIMTAIKIRDATNHSTSEAHLEELLRDIVNDNFVARRLAKKIYEEFNLNAKTQEVSVSEDQHDHSALAEGRARDSKKPTALPGSLDTNSNQATVAFQNVAHQARKTL